MHPTAAGTGLGLIADYPAIGDHGLIGDLSTAALVGVDGTIDWYCCPRFDSPSVFASILDCHRGGHWSIRPSGDGWKQGSSTSRTRTFSSPAF